MAEFSHGIAVNEAPEKDYEALTVDCEPAKGWNADASGAGQAGSNILSEAICFFVQIDT